MQVRLQSWESITNGLKIESRFLDAILSEGLPLKHARSCTNAVRDNERTLKRLLVGKPEQLDKLKLLQPEMALLKLKLKFHKVYIDRSYFKSLILILCLPFRSLL